MPMRFCIATREDGRQCGVRTAGKSFCPTHEAERDKRRQEGWQRRRKAREADEPWRRFYGTKQWRVAQAKAVERDGQCRALMPDGSRCVVEEGLEVHHKIQLRDLWVQTGGDWTEFVREACRLRDLVTLCHTHHRHADEDIRAARAST